MLVRITALNVTETHKYSGLSQVKAVKADRVAWLCLDPQLLALMFAVLSMVPEGCSSSRHLVLTQLAGSKTQEMKVTPIS